MTEARKQRIREKVSLLEELTKLRFPMPSPDLFTLRDFKVRYRLTKLSPRAIQDMEKSQRISRQQRDYTNIGLCEFHIGLIYFYNEDCLGCLQYFTNAYHQWQFVHEPNGTGLAYFAQGLAQHLNWQYEAAMASFNEVRRWLPRIELEKTTETQSNLIAKLTKALDNEYEALRQDLWQVSQTTDEPPASSSSSDETTNNTTNDAPSAEEAPSGDNPPPPSSSTLDITSDDKEEDKKENGRKIPPPDTRFSYRIPPGHIQTDDSYVWYLVLNEPTGGFFPPEIQKGSTLLLHKRPNKEIKKGELIVVKHDNDLLLDSHAVKVIPLLGFSKNILSIAWLDEVDEAAEKRMRGFKRSENHVDVSISDVMTEIPIRKENILGVVVGSWHPVIIE